MHDEGGSPCWTLGEGTDSTCNGGATGRKCGDWDLQKIDLLDLNVDFNPKDLTNSNSKVSEALASI